MAAIPGLVDLQEDRLSTPDSDMRAEPGVMKRTIFLLLASVAAVVIAGSASAQQAEAPAGDLAKQAQNPIASLISLPFQNNTNLGMGPNDRNQNVLNIQPVIPLNFGAVNLITRTIVPVVYKPDLLAEGGGTSGLGDINATFFLGPSAPASVTWAVGPALYLPTATDDALGSSRWSAGPSAVALAMPGHWVIGALVSNVWSFAGDEDGADVSSFLFQPIINYNLANQWYLTSVPIITANWNAAEGNKWTVPVGGGFGKIFRIGSQAVNGSFQAYYNVEHPELSVPLPPIAGIPIEASSGGVWTLRFQLQLLFPR